MAFVTVCLLPDADWINQGRKLANNSSLHLFSDYVRFESDTLG